MTTPAGGSVSARLATLLRNRGSHRAASTGAAVAPVLRALYELTEAHGGVVPTHAEIAATARLKSTSTVRTHLATLARLGLVKLPAPGTPRSVQLTDQGHHLIRGDHHT